VCESKDCLQYAVGVCWQLTCSAYATSHTQLFCFMNIPNLQSLVRGQMVKGVLEAYPNKTYVVVQGKAAAAVITCDPTVWCDPLQIRLAPQQEMWKTMSGQAGIGRRTWA
jgi:hypothetical protein